MNRNIERPRPYPQSDTQNAPHKEVEERDALKDRHAIEILTQEDPVLFNEDNEDNIETVEIPRVNNPAAIQPERTTASFGLADGGNMNAEIQTSGVTITSVNAQEQKLQRLQAEIKKLRETTTQKNVTMRLEMIKEELQTKQEDLDAYEQDEQYPESGHIEKERVDIAILQAKLFELNNIVDSIDKKKAA